MSCAVMQPTSSNHQRQPVSKLRKLQPAQPCNSDSKVMHGCLPQQQQTSKWEEFVETEAEMSQAVEEPDSSAAHFNIPAGTPDKSYQPLRQSHTAGRDCRTNTPLAPKNNGSALVASQQAAKPQPLPACEPPGHDTSVSKPIPEAPAKHSLVPPLKKQQKTTFKPPAVVHASHKGTLQHKLPPGQAKSTAQAAQNTGNRNGFRFDAVHCQARHVAVPTSFADLHSYKQTWSDAVTEEINIRCILLC